MPKPCCDFEALEEAKLRIVETLKASIWTPFSCFNYYINKSYTEQIAPFGECDCVSAT